MSPSIKLRPAEHKDLEFCFQVTKEAMKSYVEATFGPWEDDWQRDYVKKDFAACPQDVVMVDGKDAGLWSVAQEPTRFHLRKIYLLPAFQRRGIGSELLRNLIAESQAKSLPIELRYLMVNPVAALYERLGFQRLKEEMPYVYMRKTR